MKRIILKQKQNSSYRNISLDWQDCKQHWMQREQHSLPQPIELSMMTEERLLNLPKEIKWLLT